MDCVESPSSTFAVRTMTFDEMEPQLVRLDPNDPTKVLPERGGAICKSAADYNKFKTALESACELLGNKCGYELKEALEQVSANIKQLETRSKKKKFNR